MVRIYTKYGTPAVQESFNMVFLKDDKEIVDVAAITF